MRRFSRVMGLVVALAAVFWVAPAVLAADEDVTIAGFAFSPATVTVSVGDTVTWTNNDAATHSATANGGSFDTGNIGNGASDSVTFDTAGTFAYHCSIHAAMTGTVVVQAAGGGGGGGGGTPTTPPTDTADPAPAGGGSLFAGLAVAFVLAASVVVARRLTRVWGPGPGGF
jgi:plastocyanin